MHFLAGMLFLVLIQILLLVYLAAAVLIIAIFYFFYRWICWWHMWSAIDDLKVFIKPKPYLWFIGLFALLNIFFYINQRMEWMGDDNANLTAKEYYVVGQVLYIYRAVLSDIVYSGKYRLFVPLDRLQEAIYKQGVKYLPENDGEAGVWNDIWFIYPYSKRMLVPYNHLGTWENSLFILTPFLDQVWSNLERVATKPFADRQMYEQHYLRNFAGMAHFYAYQKYYYTIEGWARDYVQLPYYIERDERLVGWLLELKKKLKKESGAELFVQQHPKVEVMRQVALLMELVDIIDARVWSGKFDCSDPNLKLYADVRQEFAEGAGDVQPAVLRMADRKEAKQFWGVAIDSVAARYIKYVLKKYCGVGEVAGQADMKLYTEQMGMSPDEYEEYEVRVELFSKEINLIEEQINE